MDAISVDRHGKKIDRWITGKGSGRETILSKSISLQYINLGNTGRLNGPYSSRSSSGPLTRQGSGPDLAPGFDVSLLVGPVELVV